MSESEKVRLEMSLHPVDYARLCDGARLAGLPIEDFCALSLHLGMRANLEARGSGHPLFADDRLNGYSTREHRDSVLSRDKGKRHDQKKRTAVRLNQAHQEGFDAAYQGHSQRSCPYPESTEIAQDWRTGWIDGWRELAAAAPSSKRMQNECA